VSPSLSYDGKKIASACLPKQEKFPKEADKKYQEAIIELIPREVTCIEKRGGKKDGEKKPSKFQYL
jgi:hypothetical protein